MELAKYNTPADLHPYLDEVNWLYNMYKDVMAIKRRKLAGDIKWYEYPRLYAFVWWAWLCDVWFNVVIGSKIFKDPAQEFTFTARLKRYKKDYDCELTQFETEWEWRANLACWICKELLNKEDPDGHHC